MLQIKALYTLPTTPTVLTTDLLRTDWFSEISDFRRGLTDAVAARLNEEGRLEVRGLVCNQHDYRRSTTMYAIWFDGQPVMVVQNAGRECDDFSRRMITNGPLLESLCHYIQSRLIFEFEVNEFDLVDPEQLIFEEEAFLFYGGEYLGDQFGYPRVKRTEGLHLLPDAEQLLGKVIENFVFVAGDTGVEMPRYLRRHLFVMEKVRAITLEELAGKDTVQPYYAEQGITQFYWYQQCEVPLDQDIVVC